MDNDCTFAKEGIINTFHHMFPELQELEDERIRKESIFYFQEEIPQCSIQEHADKMKQWIDWLKKQGKKGINGNERDANKKELKKIEYNPDNLIEESYQQQADDLIGIVTEKPVWGEEDENRFRNLIYLVEHSKEGNGTKRGFIEFINRLKSLKDRVHPLVTWKPIDLPHWNKSSLPNNNATGFNSDYFCYKGYYINYKELFEKLPKND